MEAVSFKKRAVKRPAGRRARASSSSGEEAEGSSNIVRNDKKQKKKLNVESTKIGVKVNKGSDGSESSSDNDERYLFIISVRYVPTIPYLCLRLSPSYPRANGTIEFKPGLAILSQLETPIHREPGMKAIVPFTLSR